MPTPQAVAPQVPAWRRTLGSIVGAIGLLVAPIATHVGLAHLVQRFVVTALYSESAYHNGLRYLGKQHVFSNGDRAPGWIYGAFTLLLIPDALVILAVMMIASKIAAEDLFNLAGRVAGRTRRRDASAREVALSRLPPRFQEAANDLDRKPNQPRGA